MKAYLVFWMKAYLVFVSTGVGATKPTKSTKNPTKKPTRPPEEPPEAADVAADGTIRARAILGRERNTDPRSTLSRRAPTVPRPYSRGEPPFRDQKRVNTSLSDSILATRQKAGKHRKARRRRTKKKRKRRWVSSDGLESDGSPHPGFHHLLLPACENKTGLSQNVVRCRCGTAVCGKKLWCQASSNTCASEM